MTLTPPLSSFPSPIPAGGVVGIVAPSRWAKPEAIEQLVAFLAGEGLGAKIHPNCLLREGILAGDETARAQGVHDMFADPEISGIMCVRGGGGAGLLLDRLDFDLIRRNPKPLIGYSDATVLLNAIAQQTGLVTFHGPMASSFDSTRFDPRTAQDWRTMLRPGGSRKLSFSGVEVARSGQAKGRLVGGNSAALQSLIGTRLDWSAQDAVLFIEEVGEPLFRIERTLNQFRMAGKFDGVRAVLVGEVLGVPDNDPSVPSEWHTPYGRSLQSIVKTYVPETVPLAFQLPCGHGDYVTTFPVGAEVEVLLDNHLCELGVVA